MAVTSVSEWEFVLNAKLAPYIPAVREFWKNIEDVDIYSTGVFPVDGAPEGLMYRVTNTPARSPIKHIQVFPFVLMSYLNIAYLQGGVLEMTSKVCMNNRFTIDEFTIIEKSNLPSTFHHGSFIAFVPTDVITGVRGLGRWVYLTTPEMMGLAKDKVVITVKRKVSKYI